MLNYDLDEIPEELALDTEDGQKIQFTYTVTILESNQLWATRLDHYLSYGDPKLQWEQIIIGLAVLLSVSAVFMITLCSALNRDSQSLSNLRATYRQRWRERRQRRPGFQAVNQRDDIAPSAPLRREVGWKKISGEVFRKPEYSFIFCILVGAGTQCLLTFYSVLMCSILDWISPFDKGIYIGLTVSLFPFFGLFNGLIAARLYAFFNGT